MTESELKRQLSHDLANDPSLATVFNPPQIFSDTETAHGPSNINGIPGAAGLGSTVVVHWTNNDLIVSSFFHQKYFLKNPELDLYSKRQTNL